MQSAGKYISLLRHEGNERKTRQMGDTKVEVLLQWLEVAFTALSDIFSVCYLAEQRN